MPKGWPCSELSWLASRCVIGFEGRDEDELAGKQEVLDFETS